MLEIYQKNVQIVCNNGVKRQTINTIMTTPKYIALAICILLLGLGCEERSQEPNGAGQDLPDTTQHTSNAIVPVAHIESLGAWGEFITSTADLALVFPENYFPGLASDLEIDPQTIRITKDARNHTETLQEYLTGRGYDKDKNKAVYIKIHLAKREGLLYLKATERNITQIFQCDGNNSNCNLVFRGSKGLMPYCFDSLAQSNCLLRQDVLGI